MSIRRLRSHSSFARWTAILAPAAVLAIVACASTPKAKSDRICVPGQWTYCRCPPPNIEGDGSHQCNDKGDNFGECMPCEGGGMSEFDGGGFEVFDGGTSKTDSGDQIESQCKDKLVFVAGGRDANKTTYTGSYKGDGSFKLASTQLGEGLEFGPSIVAKTGGFFAVVKGIATTSGTNEGAILFMKHAGGTWSVPEKAGTAATTGSPVIALTQEQDVALVFRDSNNAFKYGVYNSNGWGAFVGIRGIGQDVPVPQPSPPGLALVSGKLVMSTVSGDGEGGVYVRENNTTWSTSEQIEGTKTSVARPAVVAIAVPGVKLDAMIAYLDPEHVLTTVFRDRESKAWSEPLRVDDSARVLGAVNDAPNAAVMRDGKVILVYRGVDFKARYTIFDGSRWTIPRELVETDNPEVKSTPSVAAPGCAGADATIAYVEKDETTVGIVRVFGDEVRGPYRASGMNGINFVGVGDRP